MEVARYQRPARLQRYTMPHRPLAERFRPQRYVLLVLFYTLRPRVLTRYVIQERQSPSSAQAPPASNSSLPSSPKSSRSSTGFAARRGSRVRSRRSMLDLVGRTSNVSRNLPLPPVFDGVRIISPHSFLLSYKISWPIAMIPVHRYRRAEETIRGGPETFAQVSQDDRVGAQPTV